MTHRERVDLHGMRALCAALAFGTITCGGNDEPGRGITIAAGYAGAGGTQGAPVVVQGGASTFAPPPAATVGPVIDVSTSGSGGQPSSTCSAETREGERVPVDMYFLVDSSRSMEEMVQGGTRWSAVSGALVDFLQDPRNADVGVALGYLPFVDGTCVMGDPLCLCLLGICIPLSDTIASCDVTDYVAPTIGFSLPPNVTPLVNDLLAHQRNGGTPTRPALEGALQYLGSWAAAHPGRKPVMVLATDGEPMGCDRNSPQDVADVAAAALAASIPIQTFVIGVGTSLESLHLVARAGGTNQAFLVEDSNASSAFSEALERIRGIAVPCEFLIPTQGRIDPEKVNVKFTPAGGTTPVLVAKTGDGAATTCGAEGGWYYDNPADPKTIRLCPETCSSLGGGKLQVEFGCKTIVQPLR